MSGTPLEYCHIHLGGVSHQDAYAQALRVAEEKSGEGWMLAALHPRPIPAGEGPPFPWSVDLVLMRQRE